MWDNRKIKLAHSLKKTFQRQEKWSGKIKCQYALRKDVNSYYHSMWGWLIISFQRNAPYKHREMSLHIH